jgi:hypothetical protein
MFYKLNDIFPVHVQIGDVNEFSFFLFACMDMDFGLYTFYSV